MHAFMMQDWTTIRFASGQANFTQGESGWLDLMAYQDVVFFLEVREISFATGITSMTFNYETAPFRDDSMFKAMATSAAISAAITVPDIAKATLASTVPLARFARWKIIPNAVGSGGTPSDITFRIAAAANRVV